MGNIFNPDSSLMQGLSKITDIIVLNLLTVLLSIPVITAGAALAALYDATWRIVQDEGSVYRSFFRAFKSNFKQATVLWLIIAASGFALGYCVMFYVQNELFPLVVVSAVLLLLWAVSVAWVFPLQSRFENTIWHTIKNSFLCGIGYLPRSMVMAVLKLLPWLVFLLATNTWIQMSFLWVAFWMAMTAYVSLMLLRKPFAKLMGQEEPEKTEQETDA